MSETRYMISDAAKKVDVETHVLRYWEEELDLAIARTELGHRYYTEEDIRIFRNIKELKERGIQLKAIKVLIPELKKRVSHSEEGTEDLSPSVDNIINLEEKLSERSSVQSSQPSQASQPSGTAHIPQKAQSPQEAETLPAIAGDLDKLKQFERIVSNICKQVLQENNTELESRITDTLVKEVDVLLQLREEREEERYRQLDETIRAHQKKRQLVAATKEKGTERKKRWFHL